MQARQITTYAVHSRAITEETVLPVTLEADEPRHLESGVINLYPDIRYQEIEGFGGALTDTVGYLYSTMTPECKRQFLEAYFGENGQHYRFLRMHIDSCDYSLDEYQAVADPVADPDFATFTLARDRKYMLPMLKDAMAMTTQPFSVLLSPWSPPRQWKTPPARPRNDASVYGGLPGFRQEIDYDHPSRCNGGSLKKEHYGDWARYLVKYVQAYLDEGVPVTMLSLQNESIAATEWDSCVWTAAQQKEFLRDHLYPAFEAAGLAGRVGLYIWDHNKERAVEYPREIIDETTCKMLEGIAFHWYSGDHFENLDLVKRLYPHMKLILSESCLEYRIIEGNAIEEAGLRLCHEYVQDLSHGTQAFYDWNLLLDERGGPNHVNNLCHAAFLYHTKTGELMPQKILDYLSALSRAVRPGSRRILFSSFSDRFEVAAFRTGDREVTALVLNRSDKLSPINLRMHGKGGAAILPPKTLGVFVVEE